MTNVVRIDAMQAEPTSIYMKEDDRGIYRPLRDKPLAGLTNVDKAIEVFEGMPMK